MKSDAFLVRIGVRVRAARRAADLTLEELAGHAKIDAAYLGGVERGQRNASLRVLHQIAEGLGISVGSLTDELDALGRAAVVARIRESMSKMSDDELRVLTRFAEALSQAMRSRVR